MGFKLQALKLLFPFTEDGVAACDAAGGDWKFYAKNIRTNEGIISKGSSFHQMICLTSQFFLLQRKHIAFPEEKKH